MDTLISYLLVTLLLLTGCSNEIAEEISRKEEKPVPILIAPRQVDVETKAAVDAFTASDIPSIQIFQANGNTDIQPLFPTGLDQQSRLQFTTPPVYPVNDSDVTLYGYYPKEVEDSNQQQTNEIVHFTLTGHEDLMYASASAGKKTTPKPTELLFNHKLVKVTFKIQAPDLSGESDLIHIITAGPNAGTMNLQDGKVTANATSNRHITLPTGFTIADIQTIQTIPGELLLLPKCDYSFAISIGEKYYAITLTSPNATQLWEESTSYTLTVTIRSLDKPITLKSTNKENNVTIRGSITPNI